MNPTRSTSCGKPRRRSSARRRKTAAAAGGAEPELQPVGEEEVVVVVEPPSRRLPPAARPRLLVPGPLPAPPKRAGGSRRRPGRSRPAARPGSGPRLLPPAPAASGAAAARPCRWAADSGEKDQGEAQSGQKSEDRMKTRMLRGKRNDQIGELCSENVVLMKWKELLNFHLKYQLTGWIELQ